jgi:hypothetical protein
MPITASPTTAAAIQPTDLQGERDVSVGLDSSTVGSEILLTLE